MLTNINHSNKRENALKNHSSVCGLRKYAVKVKALLYYFWQKDVGVNADARQSNAMAICSYLVF